MTISLDDLDRYESDRVSEAIKSVSGPSDKSVANIFRSERVNSELFEEKLLLQYFNYDEILSYIPFYSKIYVEVCPDCLTGINMANWNILIQKGAIVPILNAKYNKFSEEIVATALTNDHISKSEYDAFRWTYTGTRKTRICGHCVEKRKLDIHEILDAHPNVKLGKRDISTAIQNLYPFVDPDFHLIEELEKAITDGDQKTAQSLYDMSWIIRKSRSSEALNAPMIVKSSEYKDIPTSISKEIDVAIEISNTMEKRIADGLSIRIPTNIPLQKYIELSNDFRPRIGRITQKIIKESDRDSIRNSIHSDISHLNSEIRKIQTSGRYIALEAAAELYSNHSTLINAALVASALGVTIGTTGCLGGVATGAIGIAKKKGWINSGPAAERLSRILKNSISPVIDGIVSKYVGASSLSVSILSLRHDLSTAMKSTPPRASKKGARSSLRKPPRAIATE